MQLVERLEGPLGRLTTQITTSAVKLVGGVVFADAGDGRGFQPHGLSQTWDKARKQLRSFTVNEASFRVGDGPVIAATRAGFVLHLGYHKRGDKRPWAVLDCASRSLQLAYLSDDGFWRYTQTRLHRLIGAAPEELLAAHRVLYLGDEGWFDQGPWSASYAVGIRQRLSPLAGRAS